MQHFQVRMSNTTCSPTSIVTTQWALHERLTRVRYIAPFPASKCTERGCFEVRCRFVICAVVSYVLTASRLQIRMWQRHSSPTWWGWILHVLLPYPWKRHCKHLGMRTNFGVVHLSSMFLTHLNARASFAVIYTPSRFMGAKGWRPAISHQYLARAAEVAAAVCVYLCMLYLH